ncbi:MAG: dTDP-4-dehydrorhamnose reductase [Planctomycetes bacterium]|nr:dTDP-4-dehydrorhamnose reductase [Planctomycetota bacterium]
MTRKKNIRRVAIIGAGGMLGRDLHRESSRRGLDVLAFASRRELDITDAATVEDTLGSERVDAVINAAGWTDVDKAETEKVEAYAVNWGGPANLAWCCKRIGAPLVHFSTDYVFDGETANEDEANDAEEESQYAEDAATSPVNVYGSSKLAGEEAIQSSGVEHLILRTSWLFAPHGKNFVRTIVDAARQNTELPVVADQVGRPTATADLARMTYDLLECDARGIVHAASAEAASWHELAKAVVEQAALPCRVVPCATDEQPRPARRPRRSVLNISRMTALIGAPRPWREAIEPCVAELIAAATEREAWRIGPEQGENKRAA